MPGIGVLRNRRYPCLPSHFISTHHHFPTIFKLHSSLCRHGQRQQALRVFFQDKISKCLISSYICCLFLLVPLLSYLILSPGGRLDFLSYPNMERQPDRHIQRLLQTAATYDLPNGRSKGYQQEERIQSEWRFAPGPGLRQSVQEPAPLSNTYGSFSRNTSLRVCILIRPAPRSRSVRYKTLFCSSHHVQSTRAGA